MLTLGVRPSGLAQMYLNRIEEGLADMRAAQKEKITPEHDVIDECIRDQGEGYTVFSIVRLIIPSLHIR